MDYPDLLRQVLADVEAERGAGRVASYIPILAGVDPRKLGIALATVDGEVFGAGDCDEPFSIQSVSKVFMLALVLARDGDALWQRVGREPSGNAFNSLIQLELERGIPRNPFLNAGALVLIDRLLSLAGDARGAVRDFLRAEAENPRLDFDAAVAASEAAHGHRNAALAHFMASYGNIENPVETVLEHYFSQCALAASCR